jgi:hypothetical protein
MKKRKKPRVYEYILKRKSNGQEKRVKCRRMDESDEAYIAIKACGYGIDTATVYRKQFWTMASHSIVLEDATGVASISDPPASDAPPPPVAEPPSSDVDLTDEEIEKIETGPKGLAGDLKKELPNEYNVWADHEKIGAEELLGMKASVEHNFSVAEANRKLLQMKARQRLNQMAERVGVGFVPDF